MTAEGSFAPRDLGRHPPALAPAYKTSVARAPHQPLIRLEPTLAQTTGPVFGQSDIGTLDHDLLSNHAESGQPIGERIILHGQIQDGAGRPVPNVLIEIWQANAAGRYRHVNDGYLAPLDPNFGGCGRCLSDAQGRFRFHTVKPGAYPWPNGPNSWRPAHIHFSLSGPAFLQRLITQLYFEGDPLIPLCPIVQAIPDPAAIEALVARLDIDESEAFDSLAYRFDIVLRGAGSTPFENRPEGN